MEQNNFETKLEDEKPKKKNIKNRIILIEAIIILILIGSGYLIQSNVASERVEIKENLERIELINSEIERCSDFINTRSGDFDDYEYCQQLLEKFN